MHNLTIPAPISVNSARTTLTLPRLCKISPSSLIAIHDCSRITPRVNRPDDRVSNPCFSIPQRKSSLNSTYQHQGPHFLLLVSPRKKRHIRNIPMQPIQTPPTSSLRPSNSLFPNNQYSRKSASIYSSPSPTPFSTFARFLYPCKNSWIGI